MTHTATVDSLDEVTERLQEYLNCSTCIYRVECLTLGNCVMAKVTEIISFPEVGVARSWRDLRFLSIGGKIHYFN